MVYADWLESRGDLARAELVRVQCELARIAPEDRRWPALAARAAELEPKSIDGVRYRRGLPSHIDLGLDAFLACAAELRATHPAIDSARISQTTGRMAELFASGLVDGLHHLEFDTCNEVDADVMALASPALAELRSLTLRHFHARDVAAWRAFVHSPHLAKLTSFHAEHCEVGTLVVGEEAAWPSLRRLRLAKGATPAHLERIAASPLASRLELLDLESVELGAGGAAALASLSALRWLALRACDVDDRTGGILAGSPALRTLEALHVDGYTVRVAGAVALATSPHLANVARIGMRSVESGAFGAFVDACTLPALVHLDAPEGRVTDADLRVLARRPLAFRLQHLRLDRNKAISCAGIAPLAESARELRAFDAGGCSIKGAGGAALADLPHLERVDLSYNRIGMRGGAAWLAAPNPEGLRLRLVKCHITKPIVAQLRARYGARVEL